MSPAGDEVSRGRAKVAQLAERRYGPLDSFAGADQSPRQHGRRVVGGVRAGLYGAGRRCSLRDDADAVRVDWYESMSESTAARDRTTTAPDASMIRWSTWRLCGAGAASTVCSTVITGFSTVASTSRTSSPSGPP